MPRQTLPNNQEDREVYLREHDADNFIEAVKSTQTKADTLIMMLDAFWAEPEVTLRCPELRQGSRRHGYDGAPERR
jgi:hypothetical protein